jgi:hypothetical protein
MDTLEIDEQTTETILLAGLLAAIKANLQAGADLYEILDELPGEIHADIVEGLDRLGLI